MGSNHLTAIWRIAMSNRLETVRLIADAGPTLTLDLDIWLAAYHLALDHGWWPLGTEPPPSWQSPS